MASCSSNMAFCRARPMGSTAPLRTRRSQGWSAWEETLTVLTTALRPAAVITKLCRTEAHMPIPPTSSRQISKAIKRDRLRGSSGRRRLAGVQRSSTARPREWRSGEESLRKHLQKGRPRRDAVERKGSGDAARRSKTRKSRSSSLEYDCAKGGKRRRSGASKESGRSSRRVSRCAMAMLIGQGALTVDNQPSAGTRTGEHERGDEKRLEAAGGGGGGGGAGCQTGEIVTVAKEETAVWRQERPGEGGNRRGC